MTYKPRLTRINNKLCVFDLSAVVYDANRIEVLTLISETLTLKPTADDRGIGAKQLP